MHGLTLKNELKVNLQCLQKLGFHTYSFIGHHIYDLQTKYIHQVLKFLFLFEYTVKFHNTLSYYAYWCPDILLKSIYI
jgi:hypothetical protein